MAKKVPEKKIDEQPTVQDSSRNEDGTFAKGHSGNPGGAVKRDWTWASLIIEAAEKEAANGDPKKKIIAEKLVAMAVKGDARAIDMMMDRTDGKPHQTIAQTTETKAEVRVIE
ncbi:hypothetical protein LCGC14_1268410 [marine sediment metagenome]|uniref:DUF5681 domain-containing protein n=1 Tax=marine sediment metagenome TaxID=412755 RepID=A0A0F9KYX5_9ZZZZ|nr:hypothetical protein [Desulfobacterales bacterium]